MDKLRIYAVSTMAMHYRIDMPSDGGIRDGTYVEHFPALIPAESIQDAAERASAVALDRWKVSEEWYGHQALIQPVTTAFFDTALNALNAGAIAKDDEGPQAFSFSEGKMAEAQRH